MTDDTILSDIRALFKTWAGCPCSALHTLGANGSNRFYARVEGGGKQCIAAFNSDIRENEAFFYFTKQLRQRGILVPELYCVDNSRQIYLQQDLGDQTLYSYLYTKKQSGHGFDTESFSLYKQVLSDLVNIQTSASDLDFSYAYPRQSFDKQAIMWDFNYFKYYFLKLFHVQFDEQLLENDFDSLVDYLLSGDCNYFMYRDFQTRNIMLVANSSTSRVADNQNSIYYIDYQGARLGAPQYDAASLLYSSKADFSDAIRKELLHHYVDVFFEKCCINHSSRNDFICRFYAYALARIMQALGAYGYRGYVERKESFINSIPQALQNLRSIIESHADELPIPHLRQVFLHLTDSDLGIMPHPISVPSERLTITVSSFSYKRGIPQDNNGNGGGFVFDCRGLPNPGRYPEYRSYTGKDPSVIQFLQQQPAVREFIDHACAIVSISVNTYIQRNFSNLMISFGCTGGQHRSVYCAEQMADYLRKNFDCHVLLIHREQD